jgi:hypothetical protein
VNDYRPYVESVQRQLRRYYDRLSCPNNCPKKPLAPETDELYLWDCGLQTVHVKGYLRAVCQPPQ